MEIAIVGRHTRITDDMRERINVKMEKIAALAPKATRVEVHVVHERNRRMAADQERVEITLYDRAVIRTEASADDRVVALELASARIIDRLRKLSERRAKRHQYTPPLREVVKAEAVATEDRAAENQAAEDLATEDLPVESVEAWEGAPGGSVREIPLDGTPIMIRSKTHAAQPMTVSEAIDQMELVGHDFYLFLDSESGLASAVYRRRGWTYGVIHIDPDAADTVERQSA
jgi:ribosomal subunit interface protein